MGEASYAWAQDDYSHRIGRSSWVGIGYQRYALDYRSLDNGYSVSSHPGLLFICPDDRPNNSLGPAVVKPRYLSLTFTNGVDWAARHREAPYRPPHCRILFWGGTGGSSRASSMARRSRPRSTPGRQGD